LLTAETQLLFVCGYQCIVLDVYDFEDRGTTRNVVLVNGVLHEGDQIAVCGRQASISDSNCIIF